MKSAVWFFLGLVLGAAGGAYVATSIAEKKTEGQIEKATVEARNYYKEKYKNKPPKKEEPEVVTEPEEKLRRVYGKAFDLYSVPKDVVIEEPDVDHHYITPITVTDYEDEEEYTKCMLDCYADGTVTDEMGNDVEDPGGLVGSDTLDSLSTENPVAYIRNDTTQTVYEICYVDTYYEPEGGADD